MQISLQLANGHIRLFSVNGSNDVAVSKTRISSPLPPDKVDLESQSIFGYPNPLFLGTAGLVFLGLFLLFLVGRRQSSLDLFGLFLFAIT